MKKILGLSTLALMIAACGGGDDKKKTTPVASSSSSSAVSSSVSSSSSSSSVSSSSSSAAASGWQLVWSDDFEGANIDTTKWSFERNCTGGGNNELQCYTDRAQNAFVADGHLHIKAIKETFSGQAKGDDDPAYNAGDTSVTREYTSARLRSKGKGDWKYGKMDIRAKLPKGQGVWPAIWMLPTEWKYGTWPLSGEIDIMEAVNSGGTQYGNKVHGTLHYGNSWPNNVYVGKDYTPTTNVWDEFHTYTIEWEQGAVRWYVDGVHYQTQTNASWFTAKDPKAEFAPFDQKFHMIMNLAIGGNWPGNPDGTTTMPQEMLVDYVKVYTCGNNPTTGLGCASNVDPSIKPNGTPKVGDTGFAKPPLFTMYGDALATGLKFNMYNPAGAVSYTEEDEAGRGKVLHLTKKDGAGNLYFQIDGSAADLTDWLASGELVFDVKLNSKSAGSKLLVKLDSGWPSVSDTEVTLTEGAWTTYRIGVQALLDKGNSIQSGKANITKISNIFVMEPSTGMDVVFDNIRLETKK